MAYPKKEKVKSTKHVCSECIEFFDAKDLFIAQVPNRDYSTIYCGKCLKLLEITNFRPYHKVAEKKTKVEKTATTKKDTTTKTKIEPKTGAKYKIDKKLDKVKSVKTTSNKLDELKKLDFIVEKPKRKYTKKEK